ncbi:MAG TPA: hypothetical protein VJU61_06420, partial [Polyangiaceae bacterium]|nr:hypothetical protein [Polyangiaceae bacterium]
VSSTSSPRASAQVRSGMERRQPPYLLLRTDSPGTNTIIVNLWTPSDTQEAFDLVQRAVAAGWPPRR